MKEILVRVVCNDRPFVAGFIYDHTTERVIRAAPILRRLLMGKHKRQVAAIARAQRWNLEIVHGEGNRS